MIGRPPARTLTAFPSRISLASSNDFFLFCFVFPRFLRIQHLSLWLTTQARTLEARGAFLSPMARPPSFSIALNQFKLDGNGVCERKYGRNQWQNYSGSYTPGTSAYRISWGSLGQLEAGRLGAGVRGGQFIRLEQPKFSDPHPSLPTISLTESCYSPLATTPE